MQAHTFFTLSTPSPSPRQDQRDIAICAGILEQSMGARNRVGIGLTHRPAGLHRLAESILWLLKTKNTVFVLSHIALSPFFLVPTKDSAPEYK